MPTPEIRGTTVKLVSAWIAALITDSMSVMWNLITAVHWDKLAQFAAFVYSLCLIYEHFANKRKKRDKEINNVPK